MTRSFEIRVEGELTRSTLNSLGCHRYLAGGETLLRIDGIPAVIQDLVNICSQDDLTIESIVRLECP